MERCIYINMPPDPRVDISLLLVLQAILHDLYNTLLCLSRLYVFALLAVHPRDIGMELPAQPPAPLVIPVLPPRGENPNWKDILPNEIIAQILDHLVDPRARANTFHIRVEAVALHRFMLTCKAWRSFVLDTPAIWGRILLINNMPTATIQEFLFRSGIHPITIVCDYELDVEDGQDDDDTEDDEDEGEGEDSGSDDEEGGDQGDEEGEEMGQREEQTGGVDEGREQGAQEEANEAVGEGSKGPKVQDRVVIEKTWRMLLQPENIQRCDYFFVRVRADIPPWKGSRRLFGAFVGTPAPRLQHFTVISDPPSGRAMSTNLVEFTPLDDEPLGLELFAGAAPNLTTVCIIGRMGLHELAQALPPSTLHLSIGSGPHSSVEIMPDMAANPPRRLQVANWMSKLAHVPFLHTLCLTGVYWADGEGLPPGPNVSLPSLQSLKLAGDVKATRILLQKLKLNGSCSIAVYGYMLEDTAAERTEWMRFWSAAMDHLPSCAFTTWEVVVDSDFRVSGSSDGASTLKQFEFGVSVHPDMQLDYDASGFGQDYFFWYSAFTTVRAMSQDPKLVAALVNVVDLKFHLGVRAQAQVKKADAYFYSRSDIPRLLACFPAAKTLHLGQFSDDLFNRFAPFPTSFQHIVPGELPTYPLPHLERLVLSTDGFDLGDKANDCLWRYLVDRQSNLMCSPVAEVVLHCSGRLNTAPGTSRNPEEDWVDKEVLQAAIPLTRGLHCLFTTGDASPGGPCARSLSWATWEILEEFVEYEHRLVVI